MSEDTEQPASVGDSAQNNDFLNTAMALVGKLKIVHNDPRYRAVWRVSHEILGPYCGPKYDQELKDLSNAIHAYWRSQYPDLISPPNIN